MTARPWMPLYIADYLADTAHLGALQSGAYLHLIMHYWQTGSLPDDDAALARIARMTAAEWGRNRSTIAAFFQDGWRHKRIDAEIETAESVISSRSAAGKAGAEKRWQTHGKGNGKRIANASDSQWQNDAPSPSQPQKESQPLAEKRARAVDVIRAEFDGKFWPIYPNKVGKPAAFKAFCKARKAYELDVIVFGLDRYVAEKPADRAWLNPATFLNQERFNDQPAATGPPGKPRVVNGFAAAALEIAQELAHAEGTDQASNGFDTAPEPDDSAAEEPDLLDAARFPGAGRPQPRPDRH